MLLIDESIIYFDEDCGLWHACTDSFLFFFSRMPFFEAFLMRPDEALNWMLCYCSIEERLKSNSP